MKSICHWPRYDLRILQCAYLRTLGSITPTFPQKPLKLETAWQLPISILPACYDTVLNIDIPTIISEYPLFRSAVASDRSVDVWWVSKNTPKQLWPHSHLDFLFADKLFLFFGEEATLLNLIGKPTVVTGCREEPSGGSNALNAEIPLYPSQTSAIGILEMSGDVAVTQPTSIGANANPNIKLEYHYEPEFRLVSSYAISPRRWLL